MAFERTDVRGPETSEAKSHRLLGEQPAATNSN
jgi:hypothetical protein